MSSPHQIYLDYNATTPLRGEVVQAMRPYEAECFGNASSRHSAGQAAWSAVEAARESVVALAGDGSGEVVFTSGATESNFLALEGRFYELVEQGRAPESIRMALSTIEHPCVRACADKLARRGAQVTWLPVDEAGRVKPEFFDEAPPFDMVSVMAANHETGVIQPLGEIARRLDQTSFFHTDAAQWAGRIAGGMAEWGVSAMSLSGHKMYGPKGIGALVLREKRIAPLMPGSQEAGLRAGTINVPGAVGMGKAAELMPSDAAEEAQSVLKLREALWLVLAESPLTVQRTVMGELTLPNTLHLRFPGRRADRVVDALDFAGVCCSAGPACASGANDPSPVLMAMGYSEEEAMQGVRLSLGRWSTEAEIERAARVIIETISRQPARVA